MTYQPEFLRSMHETWTANVNSPLLYIFTSLHHFFLAPLHPFHYLFSVGLTGVTERSAGQRWGSTCFRAFMRLQAPMSKLRGAIDSVELLSIMNGCQCELMQRLYSRTSGEYFQSATTWKYYVINYREELLTDTDRCFFQNRLCKSLSRALLIICR